MTKPSNVKPAFALCVCNKGYAASLEPRKFYQVLPDAGAAEQDHVRVVDESGEDYLYPAQYFVTMEIPPQVHKALVRAAA